MKDCDRDIRDYHREEVALTQAQLDELKEHRDTNRKRVRDGLSDNDEPAPTRSVTQGSYAMRTVIQEPNKAYDIDDGVIFTEESLRGPQGGEKSPLDARKMVRDAVHSDQFATPPEVKKNCVRVHYSAGHHVDIPVYRSLDDSAGETYYEHAGAEWKESDPDGVNAWFKGWVGQKKATGQPNSRELIRLIKSMCKNRPSLSLPSGFVLTVLVEECYRSGAKRFDESLRDTITEMSERLENDLWVPHPVVDDEWLIDSDSENKTRNLLELLDRAVDTLDDLDLPNCTRSKALRAWKKVLRTEFFDERITEAEEDEKAATASSAAVLGAAPKPWAHIAPTNPQA